MNRSNPPSTSREASVPDSEELMKRFLVGEATDEERDAIEERFIVDPVWFETLTALEHELFLSLAQGTLSERWAKPLRAALQVSPDRQRHLDEVIQLVAGLRGTTPVNPARTPIPMPVTRGAWRLPAAAVVLLGIGFGAWWWVNRPAPDPTVAVAPAANDTTEEFVPTFVLAGGLTRSPGGADSELRIPPDAEQVRLTAVLDGSSVTVVGASMRTMTGAELNLPAETTVRPTPQGAEVSWLVPAVVLVPGDYVITYRAGAGGGVVGSRFVRIRQ